MFGRYALVRRIGVGGMAEIWKARIQGPSGFEKAVAIKKVLPQLAEDGDFVDMFIAEAKLVASLQHPNIVQVLDFGRAETGEYFIALEYVAGANLAGLERRVFEKKQKIPLEIALYIIYEAVKGLSCAHDQLNADGTPTGLIHRDISPQNILVSFAGEVKVTDFGIARMASTASHTSEGFVRGKLSYMSPEQAKAKKDIDRRSDLFSLALVLYELVTGRKLFYASSPTELYSKVINFSSLSDEDLAGIPEEVGSVLARALISDPEFRFQKGEDFEEALAGILGPQAIVHARRALAALVNTHFDAERKSDAALDARATEAPVGAHAASMGGGAGGGVMPMEEPRVLDAATTVSDSKSLRIPGGGTTVINDSKSLEVATPRRRSLAWPAAVAIVLAVMAGAAIGLPRVWTPATPAPTPIAIASVAASPIASASPVASATPEVRPSPAETRVAVAPTATPRAVARPGTVTVNARPWAEVWIDDVRVARETPWTGKIAAGRHSIRLVNAAAGFRSEATLDMPAGGTRAVQGDAKAHTIHVE